VLFDLAIDSKLRGCDLVKLKVCDVVSGGDIRNRSTVIQQKTGKPVQFEIIVRSPKEPDGLAGATPWQYS